VKLSDEPVLNLLFFVWESMINVEKIIDGKFISTQLKEEIKTGVQKLKKEKGIVPGLAFILVGENPASISYVRSKGKACEELGYHSVTENKSLNLTGTLKFTEYLFNFLCPVILMNKKL
jgi:hypothetical protein